MNNNIIKGRNSNNNLLKFTANSTSTNSAFNEDIIQNSNKNIHKQYLYGKYKSNSENKIIKYNSQNNNDINILKKFDKNSIDSEKNKIIDLPVECLNKNKNTYNYKLSQEVGIDNKNIIQKHKIISLYTEYDSKINYININNHEKSLFKNEENNIKRIDIKFLKSPEKVSKIKIPSRKDDLDFFNINNKASLESSKFINYNMIKEKTSDLTLKSTLNILKQNQLKIQIYNSSDQNYEIEFEDYIAKLNSGDFNIDKELKERPLFYLINNYLVNSKLNIRTKFHQKTEGDLSEKQLLYNNNITNSKNKARISSLINILNNKKVKKHKIFVEKIKNDCSLDKKYKIINNRNDKHKFHFLLKTEKKQRTELSTSANSKFINFCS